MEASIPSPSPWHLRTLSEQSEEKLEKSQGTVRDAAIAVWRHVSPFRDKGWIIYNWGLVRTCVGILRVSIGMSFGVTNVFPYGIVEIKSESTNKSFKVYGHRLKPFLTIWTPYFTLLLFRHDLGNFLFHPTSLLLLHLSKLLDCFNCSWSYDCATLRTICCLSVREGGDCSLIFLGILD